MRAKSFIASGVVASLLTVAGLPVAADVVCPDSSYIVVAFSKTYEDDWMPGQPYDYVTIAPHGSGETFSATGITIDVFLKNCLGDPYVGVPAGNIRIWSSNLCICTGGGDADARTDQNGHTSFSGTIEGGGCTTSLSVYADGVYIGEVVDSNGTTVKINSTDAAHESASPCFTDASDLANFASKFADPARYDICADYNETGPPTINASDLAYFASILGANCR